MSTSLLFIPGVITKSIIFILEEHPKGSDKKRQSRKLDRDDDDKNSESSKKEGKEKKVVINEPKKD